MSSVLEIYKRRNISFTKGEGVYLFSTDGEKYLDFVAGIAVNSLGHATPMLLRL
jgi:acetylornithine/N-succinyldiaminopimelate aminotransferase